MLQMNYNWRRFLHRRDITPRLDAGFLSDPERQYGEIYNPDVKTFQQLEHIPCLIILGEPGSGKSYTMFDETKELQERLRGSCDDVLFRDLRSYGEGKEIKDFIFKDKQFRRWKKGNHTLHLYIDSLDECRVLVQQVGSLLAAEFLEQVTQRNLHRLRLRIACRPTDWPATLENGLRKIWADNLQIYLLAPLRKKDVMQAATVRSMDGEQFLQAVNRANVVSFATKPKKLDFLLKMYASNQVLPGSRVELFEKGCMDLCTDTTDSRSELKYSGKLEPDVKMMLVARIAASTVYSDTSFLYDGIAQLPVNPELKYLSPGSVCGSEVSEVFDSSITDSMVREALNTPFFIHCGPGFSRWDSRVDAEFLAAWYLHKNKVLPKNALPLISLQDGAQRAIVPQQYENASWLACFYPEIFEFLLENKPDVLLSADVSDDRNRIRLTGKILQHYQDERLIYDFNFPYGLYANLAHPQIAAQIRSYLNPNTHNKDTVKVALHIAETCNLSTLQSDVVSIALNDNLPEDLRWTATTTLGAIADNQTLELIKPLIYSDPQQDPMDNLRGLALRVLWPNHLTAEELFSALTPAHADNHFGAYQSFLYENITPHLKAEDLPLALSWLIRSAGWSPNRHLETITNGIINKAMENLSEDGVLEGFVKVILNFLDSHEHFPNVQMSPDQRHKIWQTLLPLLESENTGIIWRLNYRCGFLFSAEDFGWFLSLLKENVSKGQQALIATIIAQYIGNDIDRFFAVLDAKRMFAKVAETLPFIVDSMPINCQVADEWRKNKEYKEQHEKEQQELMAQLKPGGEFDPISRVRNTLDKCDRGVDSWWRLCWALSYSLDGQYYQEAQTDLTSVPLWKEFDNGVQRRIIKIARSYVSDATPTYQVWEQFKSHRPTIAGYKAFRLLQINAPRDLDTLGVDVWRSWCDVIVAFQEYEVEAYNAQKELIALAYRYVPSQVKSAFWSDLEVNEGSRQLSLGSLKISLCTESDLQDEMMSHIKSKQTTPAMLRVLLNDLLARDHGGAREWAKGLILAQNLTDESKTEEMLIASESLILHSQDACWNTIWPLILIDKDFGLKLMSRMIFPTGGDKANLQSRLTYTQLADLFIWLDRNFPQMDDADDSADGFMDVSDMRSIGWWKNSIPGFLAHQGTHEACNAIARIIQEIPRATYLKQLHQTAREKVYSLSWIPPTPEQILILIHSQERRLVRNGTELLNVLTEALETLERELYDTTPAIRDIWDKSGSYKHEKWRPIQENEFSDYVMRFLKRHLIGKRIVLGREVERQRTLGITKGQRTDILVTVPTNGLRGENTEIEAIIEVKGCWHGELATALQTQLVETYLKDNSCNYGLYLIGWFTCAEWNDCHQKWSLEEAKKFFAKQATDQSVAGNEVRAFVMKTGLPSINALTI